MTVTVTPEAEPVPAAWREKPPLADLLKPGQTGRLTSNGQTRYLHCVCARFVITLRNERPVGMAGRDDFAWAAPVWALLETGAETPAGRLALARGMLPRLPCGECRGHWSAVLRESPPDVETARGFRLWVWAQRNEIARRKGKPEWSLEQAGIAEG